jgi:L-malate glycosyltransferase
MLILHTAHTYPPSANGVAEVVSQISSRLAQRGHEVHVATSRPSGTLQQERLNGVHVHRFDVRGDAVSGMKGDVDQYLRFVNSKPWGVLAMHCAHVWSTDALLPHLPQLGMPIVFVSHGLSALDVPAYQSYWANLADALKTVNHVALSPLNEESTFCPRYGLPCPRIIPNGVDPENWGMPPVNVRDRWGIGKSPWLISLSNHNPLKGHADFFQVVRSIRKQRGDAHGTIIGGHYPAEKWNLGRLGVKGGCWYKCKASSMLGSGIDLRAGVPRADVVSAVKEADLLLITSTWEASPLTMLESMAAGTPWVSFDVGCARENAGGIVVGSNREMAETVLGLLENPARCEQLGQEGRARIASKHDWEVITDQYEELYSATAAAAAV